MEWTDQTLLARCSRVSDEEEEVQGPSGATLPIPEEVETRRDEAGPSAVGASSSRPRKLPARHPVHRLLPEQRRAIVARMTSDWGRFLSILLLREPEQHLSLQS